MEIAGLALPILVLVIGGLCVPALIETKRRDASSHGEDRFSAGIRVLDTAEKPKTRPFNRPGPPVLGGKMQRPVAPTNKDNAELAALKATRAAQIARRAAAARRRLTLLTVEFAVTVVVLAMCATALLPWLWAALPFSVMAGTLGLGAKAARKGRENDQKLCQQIELVASRPAVGRQVSATEKRIIAEKTAKISVKAPPSAPNCEADKATKPELGITRKDVTKPGPAEKSEKETAKLSGQTTSANREDKASKLAKAAGSEVEAGAPVGKLAANSQQNKSDLQAAAQNPAKLAEDKAASAAKVDATPAQTDRAERTPSAKARSTKTMMEKTTSAKTTPDQAARPGSATELDFPVKDPAETKPTSQMAAMMRMPKPTYQLKPMVQRRDIDASALLEEQTQTLAKVPFRPSKPRTHYEPSLTTAQLVAQEELEKLNVDAILDQRRVANR